MYTSLCITLLFLCGGYFLFASSACNDSVFTKANRDGITRRSILSDGDFIIQGIMPFTSDSNCSDVSRSTMAWMFAMKSAIDEINNDPQVLPGYHLGYQFDDSCVSIPSVMARGIEIVSLHRPHSVCRADFLDCIDSQHGGKATVKRVTAVIGTSMSFTTIPLASLLGLYSIPQISFAASSRLLSKKNLYKSFFRTIPSDENQVLAMLDVIEKFRWNYIFVVGSDDNYGKLGISTLKQHAPSRNVCIARDEYIPYNTEGVNTKAKMIVEKIKAEERAIVVVLFCYLSQGEAIFKEARKQGIKRLWLTSDAWSPGAVNLNISKEYLIGLLAISTRKQFIPGLLPYITQKVVSDYHCNIWLRMYLHKYHSCTKKSGSRYGFVCGQEEKDPDPNLLARHIIGTYDGNLPNIIDGVKAIAYSIQSVLKDSCNFSRPDVNKTLCPPNVQLETKAVTEQLKYTNFTGVLDSKVQFDENGDPKYAFYTVDNIYEDKSGKLKFKTIASWQNEGTSRRLSIDTNSMTWPLHYGNRAPESTCSTECLPGQFVAAETECCWGCQPCAKNSVSNVSMARKCTPCPNGYHTDPKQTICIKTPILYLQAHDAGGISIVVVSGVGVVISLISILIFYNLRKSPVVAESAPHLLFFSLIVLIVTFFYGPLHVVKPDETLCSGRSAFFFILFSVYAIVLLAKTRLVTHFLEHKVQKVIKMETGGLHFIFISVLMLIELVLIIVWLKIDPVPVGIMNISGSNEIWLECSVELSALRLIATLFPCAILLVATATAFRERNSEHPFHEPKFVSFTTIALCIIIVAFLPTFKYVVGIYQAIVMAFTVDVFGFTYLGCLMVPKLYVGLLRRERNLSANDANPNQDSCQVHDIPGARNGYSGDDNRNLTPSHPSHTNGKQETPKLQLLPRNIMAQRKSLDDLDLHPPLEKKMSENNSHSELILSADPNAC